MPKNYKNTRVRSRALAATAFSALLIGSGAAALDSSAARANAAAQDYTIPAAPVASALNRLADTSGAQLVYDAGLTRTVTTRGLKGRHTLNGALGTLLSGTGLAYRLAPNGTSVAIMLAENNTGTQADAGVIALPEVEVTATQGSVGTGDPTGTGPGESGGRFTGYNAINATAAMKDNIPILQTPVAVQVVPRETLDDQQDITIQQALVGNVSSVYQATSPTFTSFNIRGFNDTDNQVYYNGLSFADAVNFDTANVQSFQVLKGPAAILYGRVEPGGIVYVQTKLPQAIPYYTKSHG